MCAPALRSLAQKDAREGYGRRAAGPVGVSSRRRPRAGNEAPRFARRKTGCFGLAGKSYASL